MAFAFWDMELRMTNQEKGGPAGLTYSSGEGEDTVLRNITEGISRQNVILSFLQVGQSCLEQEGLLFSDESGRGEC